MTKPIPARPNLEFDRNQARALLDAAKSSRPEARSRFESHHPRGFPAAPRMADALLVVAREYGFRSWPQWKAFVETRTMDRHKQAEMAARAVCSNDLAWARVLLSADPALAREDFYLACACGEVGTVMAAIDQDPALVNRKGGVNAWEPLQYACFSRWLRADAGRTARIVEVARLLLARGADPNAHHMIDWMGDPWKETVLFAAAGIANHAGLTRLLLEAGADVNEGLPEPEPAAAKGLGTEALYHVCEFRDTACLALLLDARPHPDFVSFSMGRALDFENPEAVRLFLDHGADPNFRIPWADNRTHLHKAIENRRSAQVIEALLDAGANPRAQDAHGLTPYQYAVRYGLDQIAGLLDKRGPCEATDADRLLGRAVRGQTVQKSVPIPPDLLCDAARRDDVRGIEALLAAGADIGACNVGQYGSPPLHWAAWRGRFAAVRTLVEHGADIHWVNCYGGAALGTAIHGSANCFDPDGGPAMRLPEEAFPGQYVEIVDYLLAKGAKPPDSIHGGSEPVREALRKQGIPDAEEDATVPSAT
jgi:ankyrin repeat protein